LKFILNTLKLLPKGCKAVAFGSRAYGTPKKYSDIDIALCSEEKIPLLTISIVNEQFENSNLPYLVDLVDIKTLPESFQEKVEKDGMVLN